MAMLIVAAAAVTMTQFVWVGVLEGLHIHKMLVWWAIPFLMLSLAGVLVQMIYSFFFSNSFAAFGPGGLIMPVVAIAIAVYLVFLARTIIGIFRSPARSRYFS